MAEGETLNGLAAGLFARPAALAFHRPNPSMVSALDAAIDLQRDLSADMAVLHSVMGLGHTFER